MISFSKHRTFNINHEEVYRIDFSVQGHGCRRQFATEQERDAYELAIKDMAAAMTNMLKLETDLLPQR